MSRWRVSLLACPGCSKCSIQKYLRVSVLSGVQQRLGDAKHLNWGAMPRMVQHRVGRVAEPRHTTGGDRVPDFADRCHPAGVVQQGARLTWPTRPQALNEAGEGGCGLGAIELTLPVPLPEGDRQLTP